MEALGRVNRKGKGRIRAKDRESVGKRSFEIVTVTGVSAHREARLGPRADFPVAAGSGRLGAANGALAEGIGALIVRTGAKAVDGPTTLEI